MTSQDPQQQSPAAAPSTRDATIEQYLPLVKHVIRGMASSGASSVLDAEDLVAWGTVGLIEAVDRFDPSRGVTFVGYASMRIRGAILDAYRSLDPVPRRVRRITRAVEQARESLSFELERTPARHELLAATGLPAKDLWLAEKAASYAVVSIDAARAGESEDDVPGLSIASEEEDMTGRVERQEAVAALALAVEKLSPRDLLVISLRYQEEMTMNEIAHILGVSPSRVTQLHNRALAFLRGRLGAALAA